MTSNFNQRLTKSVSAARRFAPDSLRHVGNRRNVIRHGARRQMTWDHNFMQSIAVVVGNGLTIDYCCSNAVDFDPRNPFG